MIDDITWSITDSIDGHDLQSLKKLIWKFPDQLYKFDYLERSPLHHAAQEGVYEAVVFLITAGADINAGCKADGTNSLNSACRGGHHKIAEYLLDRGARMDVSTSLRNPLFSIIVESVKEIMNKTWGPSTGEAPQIVKLLLERGIDSKIRYNTRTMKNMDAVAFAMMMGAHDLAHIIALWHSQGDEAEAQAAMAEGRRIARANTKPVLKCEQVAPS